MTLAEQFDLAAPRYDLLTALNPGYHRALRRAAGELLGRLGEHPRLWDLGCGSGLSTRALLDAADRLGVHPTITGLDASAEMLARARRKTWPAGIRFVHAMAQDLPDLPPEDGDRAADGAFAAYLLRNVPAGQRDEVIRGVVEQVRPGGWIALQDYHVGADPRAIALWTAVCFGVVLPLAVLLRGNPAIYRYLWRSVLANDTPARLQARLERTGLHRISWSTAGGWQRGILHTVTAQRPEHPDHPRPWIPARLVMARERT